MTKKETIATELQPIPDSALDEILDFVRFIKAKATHETMGLAVVSEPSLSKDWLRVEEDKAWKNL